MKLRRVGENPAAMVMYHVPAGAHPDTAALDVLTGVLGDTPSGRLYKALVDNKKAVGANMGVEPLHDPGFMVASVRLQGQQNLQEATQSDAQDHRQRVTDRPARKRWTGSRRAC